MKKSIISLVLLSLVFGSFCAINYVGAQVANNDDQLLATAESELIGDVNGSVAQPDRQQLTIVEGKNCTNITIRKGIITEVGGNYFRVSVFNLNYRVNANDKTTIIRKFGGKSNLDEFTSGDIVNVLGTVDVNSFTIGAKSIRNFSIQAEGAIVGSIENIYPTSSIDVKSGNKVKKVLIENTTKIFRNDGSNGSFNDFVKNQLVTVTGILNTRLNLTFATKVQIRCVCQKINGQSLCK